MLRMFDGTWTNDCVAVVMDALHTVERDGGEVGGSVAGNSHSSRIPVLFAVV